MTAGRFGRRVSVLIAGTACRAFLRITRLPTFHASQPRNALRRLNMVNGLLWSAAGYRQREGGASPLGYAVAFARRRLGTWIARPRATSPASLTASASVGCGAIPSATVSTV